MIRSSGRFARTIQAQHADLGTGEETEGDILDDLTLGWDDLAHAEHGHYVLSHLFQSYFIGKTALASLLTPCRAICTEVTTSQSTKP